MPARRNMAIVILGSSADDHALHMHEHLRSAGRDVELLDSQLFPEQIGLAFDPQSGAGAIQFPSGRELSWSDIESVYWRNYGGVARSPLPDADQAFIAENDSRSLLETFLMQLPVRWVNGWEAFRLHQTKPVCLARVAALGVRVPKTIVTNDPQHATDFARQHPRVIFKPVQGGDQTRPLTSRHLMPENLDHLRFAPVTLQEEVPGTNIRVFVAGDRVFACEVATEHLDYREDPQPRLAVHTLPPAMESLSVHIARELELLWTGIDFRLTRDDQYVFLEANPSPMFLGFEVQTGLPLTAALAKLLTGTE